jgi:hypothetical protein
MSSGPVDLPAISRVFHDYLTSEDGKTFAIGRGMALGMFTVVLWLPVGISIWMAATIKPTAPDWAIYLGGVGTFYLTSGGAVMALVWGTKPTEPKPPEAPKTSETT